MKFRRPITLVTALLLLSLSVLGCGGEAANSATEADELAQYLNENPDAPKSGSEAPAGIDGPTGLPGEAGQ